MLSSILINGTKCFCRIRTLGFITLLLSALLFGCQKKQIPFRNISGKAQGTTYHISYNNIKDRDYSIQIDSIFKVLDQSFSLWDTTSTLVLINKNQFSGKVNKHFEILFNASQRFYKKTDGYFDIRVGPLVNAWGFGRQNIHKVPNPSQIDSLRNLIAKVELNNEGRIVKENSNAQLDFNAIAQGYTVDVLCDFLKRQKVKDFLVEVGGEVMVKGKNKENKYWKVGVESPTNDGELKVVLKLKNRALNTSGSYRKYWIKDGVKYSHAINPFTGYPVQHSVLSVSVLAKDCMTADAYATAFLVMGLDSAKKIAKKNRIQFFAIYDEDKTYQTKKFKKYLVHKN